jgi:hypothetical protein
LNGNPATASRDEQLEAGGSYLVVTSSATHTARVLDDRTGNQLQRFDHVTDAEPSDGNQIMLVVAVPERKVRVVQGR